MEGSVPKPPSSAAAPSSPAASPSSSFLAFFFFFFIRPRSRPSSAASGGGVSVSGAVAEVVLVDARASESCSVDGLCDLRDVSTEAWSQFAKGAEGEGGGVLTTAVSFSSLGADMISTLPSSATTTFSSSNATDLRGLSSGDCFCKGRGKFSTRSTR